jgi:TonB family protein
MRRRWHQRDGWVLTGSFLVAALVHASVAFPLKNWVDELFAKSTPGPVKVVRLSPEQWSRSLNAAKQAKRKMTPTINGGPALSEKTPPPKPAEEKKAEPKVEEKLNGQIVEVPPTADDSPNPEAKYLSKYNARVEKESVARPDQRDSSMKRVTNKLQTQERQGSPEQAIPTPGLTVKGDGLEADQPGEPNKAQGGPSKGDTQFVLEVPDLVRRDSVALKVSDLPGQAHRLSNRDGSEALRGNSDKLVLQLGEGNESIAGGGGGGKKGDLNAPEQKSLPSLAALRPTLGTVARISGSPSRDYVEGVPEGEGTFLNTKEFKYATFFYRVRDSVATFWEDQVYREYRRRDPTGNIYGVRDRATLLQVQLNREGRLEDVRIEQTSGVEFLDHVAVQAFRMAEPFPNPPPALADADGNIRFSFQFVVVMQSRGPLNLFR